MLILDRDTIPPNAHYTDADVAYVLLYLRENGHTSRKDLITYLEMGEGSFRSMMKVLSDTDFIHSSRKGIALGYNGNRLAASLGIRPLELEVGYALGTYRQAMKVANAADKIGTGMEQVKISTMAGGVGCTTWVMKGNDLLMPPHMSTMPEAYDIARQLVVSADLKDGDVLLVCGADTPRAARTAAMTVALDLV